MKEIKDLPKLGTPEWEEYMIAKWKPVLDEDGNFEPIPDKYKRKVTAVLL